MIAFGGGGDRAALEAELELGPLRRLGGVGAASGGAPALLPVFWTQSDVLWTVIHGTRQ